MRTRTLAGLIVLMVVVAACGNAATTTTQPAQTTSSPATGTTTDEVATTATTAPPTTSTRPETTTTASPSTTAAEAATATVELAVATVQAWLADEHASSEPPEGVLGPSEVVCAESGAIPVGAVLACRLVPNTSSAAQLDDAGIVIYVLDGDGRVAWTVGTDVPSSAAGLAEALAFAGTDLMCRDLVDPEIASGIFGGVGRPFDSAYFWSLAYWSLTGAPDRMDADLDGIPCETVHEPAVVTRVLSGGPMW